MKRRPGWKPPVEPWRAVRDGAGQWVVVNTKDEQPLHSEDPLERIQAVHLAAAAPQLVDVLQQVIHRMETLVERSWQWKVDEKLLLESWGVVILSKPPYEEVLAIERSGRQPELDFGAQSQASAGVRVA